MTHEANDSGIATDSLIAQLIAQDRPSAYESRSEDGEKDEPSSSDSEARGQRRKSRAKKGATVPFGCDARDAVHAAHSMLHAPCMDISQVRPASRQPSPHPQRAGGRGVIRARPGSQAGPGRTSRSSAFSKPWSCMAETGRHALLWWPAGTLMPSSLMRSATL
jgi:hypothetical protein